MILKVEDVTEVEEVFVVEDVIVEVIVRVIKKIVSSKSKKIQMTKL